LGPCDGSHAKQPEKPRESNPSVASPARSVAAYRQCDATFMIAERSQRIVLTRFRDLMEEPGLSRP